ncbi:hypothetical protein BU14_0397s0008 [Porphyra umbilicalis]|uniref:Uncharacterized protein n=1 Tax=Porphyra umbilicalis TaxID=2786 RepID=A0A1X6NW94_PORUM|nr:hypothetical protein BU14_0397s0008 [Porphyra umbilicalis]|eukprot:OSX72884.1 hypothetical protein BU14_0397s0008 [Porphyra umbilicalis]
MTDQEAEVIIEGPRASDILQWGTPPDAPRPRHPYQFFAYGNVEKPTEGLVWKVRRRPRAPSAARSGGGGGSGAAVGHDPAAVVPTARILTPNPAGILFQKWRQGKVIVEPEADTIARYEELTAEAAAAGKPGPPKPDFLK